MDEKSNNEKDVKIEEPKQETPTSPSNSQNESEISEFEQLSNFTENKIPYSRFKEVNDERKTLKQELDNLKSQINSKVEEAVYQAKMKNLIDNTQIPSYAAPEEDIEINVLKNEVNELKSQLQQFSRATESNLIKQELKQLKEIFPAMSEEHVLALRKTNPNASIEECAKYSHDQFSSHAKKVYEKLLQEKKQAAENLKTSISSFPKLPSMKPEERPKTIKEVTAFIKKNLGQE